MTARCLAALRLALAACAVLVGVALVRGVTYALTHATAAIVRVAGP